ncbi:MAG: response regulator [Sandaracinaceae bacterium]|nr:MAG: response regulator [Sandaracinaceae bacterium]
MTPARERWPVRRRVYVGRMSVGPRIVLVDDDRMLLAIVARVFEAQGFAVRAFAEPQRALESVLEEPPDVLLSDCRMPGMSRAVSLRPRPARDRAPFHRALDWRQGAPRGRRRSCRRRHARQAGADGRARAPDRAECPPTAPPRLRRAATPRGRRRGPSRRDGLRSRHAALRAGRRAPACRGGSCRRGRCSSRQAADRRAARSSPGPSRRARPLR